MSSEAGTSETGPAAGPVLTKEPDHGTGTGTGWAEDAGTRGRTNVALIVVRRIAEYTADLVEGTSRTRRRLAGLGLGESGATAHVSGYAEQIDVRLDVPLLYPTPIGPTVDAVRETVRERVHTLTGYTVRSVDVTVTALTPPTRDAAAGPRPRVV